MKSYQRKVGLLDLLTSSILDKEGTMRHLLVERPYPPYIISSCLALFSVLVLPSLIYQYQNELPTPEGSLIYALLTTLAISFVFFVISTTIMLRILGISAAIIKVIAAIMYSLVAAIPIMLGYYIANYAINGELTILSFLCTGQISEGDWLTGLFPLLIYTAMALGFLVFVGAIRAIGKTPTITAYLLALLCIPLLIGSFIVGITCAEALYPDTSLRIGTFFSSLFEVS
ncbi:MAG: hypothetical protein NTV65_09150 [Proteobacteria bacterium]|nr:hypothetical protein [Pseudomonadota bacterium]